MPKRAAQRVDLVSTDARWKGHAAAVRRAALVAFGQGEVVIQLSNDDEVQALNARFRGKDKPTNVLSFPDGEDGRLGDIILAYETIAREATEQHKRFKDHLAHLVVHGVLHLQGYDHETERDANRMEDKERMLLAAMGIADPYESR